MLSTLSDGWKMNQVLDNTKGVYKDKDKPPYEGYSNPPIKDLVRTSFDPSKLRCY